MRNYYCNTISPISIPIPIPIPYPAPQQQQSQPQHRSSSRTATLSSGVAAVVSSSPTIDTAASSHNNNYNYYNQHHRRRRTPPPQQPQPQPQPHVLLLHASSSQSSLSSSSSSSSCPSSPSQQPNASLSPSPLSLFAPTPTTIPSSSSHNKNNNNIIHSQQSLASIINNNNNNKHHRRTTSTSKINKLTSSSSAMASGTFHRSASFTTRRRGGMLLYPPIVRNLQKSSKPQTFVTLLLIFLPFAFAFLYTVDIRTHVMATLRRPSTTTKTNKINRITTTTLDTNNRINSSNSRTTTTTNEKTLLSPDDDGAVVINVDSMATTAQQTTTTTHTDPKSVSSKEDNVGSVVPVAAKDVDGGNYQQQHSATLPPPSAVSSSVTSSSTTTVTSSSAQAVSNGDVQKAITPLSPSSVSSESDSSGNGNNQLTTNTNMINPNNMNNNPNTNVNMKQTNNINNNNNGNTNTNNNNHNGIPPPMLPKQHPNHDLLNTIRARTQMTPRWPMTPKSRGDILKTYGQAFSSMLVSHKLKVVYIPVFKVATTSMMWNIAFLENNPVIMEANRTEETGELMKIIHDMSSSAWHPTHTVYDLDPHEISKILDDPEYLKFGFVRNPYDRIVSAYVDKVVRPEIFDEEYQDQMYSLYGDDVEIRRKVNETRPSFLEFLQRVKEIMERPRVKSDDLNSREAYEDNTSRRDMHWRPQVELLHPDIIHLDFVGHFDRINEDRQVIIQWMHRNTSRRLPKQRSRRLHSTDPKYKEELLDKLRQDEKLRNLLLTIYKEDFSRFHFSTDVPTIADLSSSSSSIDSQQA